MAVMVVVKLAIVGKRPILQHQWYVVVFIRQLGVDVGIAFQQIETRKAHVQIPSRAPPAMIVIPESGCSPAVAVPKRTCFTWCERIGREPVRLGLRDPPVQMDNRRPIEIVGVCDDDGASSPRFDRWTGKAAVVSPDSR